MYLAPFFSTGRHDANVQGKGAGQRGKRGPTEPPDERLTSVCMSLCMYVHMVLYLQNLKIPPPRFIKIS